MTKRNECREVDIFVQNTNAFVSLGNGYLLCIGTRAEVDKADATRIAEMIQEAMAFSRYQTIGSAKGMRLH